MTPGQELFYRSVMGLCLYLIWKYLYPDHDLMKRPVATRVVWLLIVTLLSVFISGAFMRIHFN